MDALITKVAQQLNLEEAVVRRGIGQILQFCQQQVPPDYKAYFDKIPGANNLVRTADEPLPDDVSKPAQPKSFLGLLLSFVIWILTAGPILDFLKKILTPLLGDKAPELLDSVSDSASLASKLQSLGITTEKVAPLVQNVVKYMRENLGDEQVDDMLNQIPAISPLLEAAKKDE